MALTLQIIEDLAPDQSSLAVAKKLLAASNWPLRGQDATVHSIWGQCKGSGANPYLTMADVENHGYKCTCPSRKFPCKHVLALMWMFNNDSTVFSPSEPPEWVTEWLSRRRRPSNIAPTEEQTKAKPTKDIRDVAEALGVDEALTAESDVQKTEQKQARALQTAQATQQAVLDGLAELELWIQDQLRTGVLALCKELRERTRRIAARMVDAKAATLAARIDELSSIAAPFPLEQQTQIVLQELGCWLLLSRAYQMSPEDPDAKRAVIGAESRVQLESLLSATDIADGSATDQVQTQLRLNGKWLCIGEQISQQRNGLVSHASYLWPLDPQLAVHLQIPAMLLDYYPASAGKRQSSLRAGMVIQGELWLYPSRLPQRALLNDYQVLDSGTVVDWQSLPSLRHSALEIAEQFILHRQQQPWLFTTTTLMGPCQLYQDKQLGFWLKKQNQTLKLTNTHLPEACGGPLQNACIRWNGREAELITAITQQFGVIPC